MFANQLKELRKNYGYTQVMLAEKLNVTKGTVGNWESGTREPDISMLIKIAKLFNVSVDYLICGKLESKEIKFARSFFKTWLMYDYYTYDELEIKLNTNIATIKSWADGYGDYFNDKLFIISDLIGCPLNTLLGRYNNESTPEVIDINAERPLTTDKFDDDIERKAAYKGNKTDDNTPVSHS